MRRRELLKWLCRLAAGYVGLNLASEIPPLVKINTALFQEVRAQPCEAEFCPVECEEEFFCEEEFCPVECEEEFCPAEIREGEFCPVDGLCTTEGCGEDSCTTADRCDGDTEGHACAQKDVCDIDVSGDCVNDWCDGDASGDCHNDVGPSCEEDELLCPDDEDFCLLDEDTCPEDVVCPEDLCTGDYSGRCRADSSGGCVNDACVSDKSGMCQTDWCAADASGGCKADECVSDKSGACGNDNCVADKSGACQADECASDSSGGCVSDNCKSDSSKGCVSDNCEADSSGSCVGDNCEADASGGCSADQCKGDASGACKADNCEIDTSGGCKGDACVADKSGACKADACVNDKSGACLTDNCVADESGACLADECVSDKSGGCIGDNCRSDISKLCVNDHCEADSSGGCTIADRCNTDASGRCGIDVCVLDVSSDCESDLCREDRSPDVCEEDVDCAKDTCAFDLSPRLTTIGKQVGRTGLNKAMRMLYVSCIFMLVIGSIFAPVHAAAVIDSTNAVFYPAPNYTTAGTVSVDAPVGPFLRDCDSDGFLEADVNGDGLCENDPEVRDYNDDGTRELPLETNFTGEFNFTCFYIPDDVAIVSTGPLTIKASSEVAVFGAMRLNSGAQISTPAKIDLRTSAWLSEDGSPINFTTALSGEIDETQTVFDQNETLPHIVYRSICEKVVAVPVMAKGGVLIVSLLLIGIAVGTLRRRKGDS